MVDANIDLFAKFELRQNSVNLLAKFEVGQDSQNLFAEVTVAQSASVNLFAEFRRYPIWSGTPQNLFAKFFRGVDGTAELYAQFNVVATAELKGVFIIRKSASANLFMEMRVYIHFAELWNDLKGILLIARPASADLFSEVTVRQEASVELFSEATIRHSGSAELFSEATIRHPGSAELFAKLMPRRSDAKDLFFEMVIIPAVNLKGVFTVRQTGTATLAAICYVRHPTYQWTTRRYLQGVIDAPETLIGDAKLEYVVEGVMEDIQGELGANSISYAAWTDITLTPVLIRRATTYGTVAALYARHSRTFTSRVIPTVAPVTVTTIGDDERAMNYWQDKMDVALKNYLSITGSAIIWVSTEDEDPVFTMADIPLSEWNPADDLLEWHNWLNQRNY